MKVYNLNIDTSKPTNQVVQMQQNATGLLSANITNDGKYIRNLSCTMYDGANEISATDGGFKVDVGAEPKHVKIEAKSTPVECSAQYIVSVSGAHRTKSVALNILQLEAGVYNQSEFYGIAKRFGNGYAKPYASQLSNVNFHTVWFAPNNTVQPVWFGKIINNKYVWFNADEPIVVSDYTDIFNMK